jgi:hypothetical protein
MRVFFVVDVDNDFDGNQSEAATWLESHLARSSFDNTVTAYFSLADMVLDSEEKAGVFE